MEKKNGKEYSCRLVDLNNVDLLKINIAYEVCDSILKMKLKYQKVEDCYLSRIGYCFSIDDNSLKVKYFGLGPMETYVDKHHYSSIGEYDYIVKDNEPIYLKPQEYGHHHYVSKLSIGNIDVFADKVFSFNALPYSEKDLMYTKHNYELVQDNKIYVNLDYFMSGVGSHSCGPVLETKYQTPNQGEIEFFLSIKN